MVHPLLSRALISAAASLATSAVLLKTAQGPRKLHQDGEDEGDNEGIRRTLKRAQIDIEPASVELQTRIFLQNIVDTPKNALRRLRGEKGPSEDSEPEVRPKRTEKKRRKKRRSAQKRKTSQKKTGDKEQRSPASKNRKRSSSARPKNRRRKGEEQEWGIGASIRAEVKKQVKEVAVESFKETLDAASDRIADTKEALVEKGQVLGASLKASLPDDVSGSLSNAAGSLKSGARKVSEQVKDALPDSANDVPKEVTKGLKGLGRYLQGPGSQDYDDDNERKNLSGKNDFVSAQVEGEGKDEIVANPSPDFKSLQALKNDYPMADDNDVFVDDTSLKTNRQPQPNSQGRSIVERRLRAVQGSKNDRIDGDIDDK